MSLIQPYATVELGKGEDLDLTWRWGGGYLQSVEVTLAEGDKSPSCSVSIYDPGRKAIDKLLAYVDSVGGLEPIERPKAADAESAPLTGDYAIGSGGAASGNLSANMKAALDLLAIKEVGTYEASGYKIKNGGGTFSSFASHPGGGAAGRYQFLASTWAEVAEQEGLKDFSPESQDKGAINRFTRRGAVEAIESGNIQKALEGNYPGPVDCASISPSTSGMACEWAAMPPNRYGQSSLTMTEAIEIFKSRVAFYGGKQEPAAAVESASTAAAATSAVATPVAETVSLAGQQMTIGLGFDGSIVAEYAFINTSINFSLYDQNIVQLGGQGASWVLSQRKKNTAYINLNFKQIATKICNSYGLNLDMPEDGPTYEYFPQRGISDYQALLIEARRIGFRVYCVGNTLSIKSRVKAVPNLFTLNRTENLGLVFNVSHTAQSEGSGAKKDSASDTSFTLGARKTDVDPDTGEQKVVKKEDKRGAGESADASTTGTATAAAAPRTDGTTDEIDAARKDADSRLNGVGADWEAPTTPELLLIAPDNAIRTEDISEQIDRVWMLDTITHSLSESGFKTTGKLWSPMKSKFQAAGESADLKGDYSIGNVPPLNPGGFIVPTTGVFTSPYGQRNGRLHNGVDIAGSQGTAVWAAADGVVNFVHSSSDPLSSFGGGTPPYTGYGNTVAIQHAEGYETFYAHLGEVTVTQGQQIKQGQKLGGQANSGSSQGIHLHTGASLNGQSINPATLYKLPGQDQQV